MRKIEQKLLDCFNKSKPYLSIIDSIIIDNDNHYTKIINYYNYDALVFSKRTNINGGKIIYFCLPSYDGKLSHTTKSRINTFLAEYGLKISQKNYCYYCNDKEIELDKVYFIIKDAKGNYNIK